MSGAWRYRSCPACGDTFPAGMLKPLRLGGSHWRDKGWGWRVCPVCAHKGQTKNFPIVQDLRRKVVAR